MNEATLSDVFQALSDPTRRGIVELLRSGPRTAGDLAQAFPLAKSTLSAHFAALRHAGLVGAERRGRSIIYRLTPAALKEVVATVKEWLEPLPAGGPRAPHALPVPAPGAWASGSSNGALPSAWPSAPAGASPPERLHPPRHGEPEQTRRRGAARVLLVEGALAVLLARLTGTPAGQAPFGPGSGAAGALGDAAPLAPAPRRSLGPSGTRRGGLAHLVRFTPQA
jgi:DNA-binding transcriptional ArsR family regulator